MAEITIQDRMYKNVFVCMKCNAKIRTNKPSETRCRKCGSIKIRNRRKPAKK